MPKLCKFFINLNAFSNMPNLVAATAVALNQGWIKYKQEFNDRLRQDLVSLRFFSVRRTLTDYAGPTVTPSVGNWFQTYQSAFTTSGSVGFDAEKWVLMQYKVDKLWTDQELNSFKGKWDPKLSAPFNGSRLNYKFFTDYLVGNVMFPVLKEELETIMLYKGKRVNPTVNVASTADKAFDGLEIVTNRLINANKIVPAAVGNFNDGVYYDRVLAFCDGMSEVGKNTPRRILCDPDIVRKTYRDIWSKNKAVESLRMMGNTVECDIPGTNKTLVGTPMMAGKQRLICDLSPLQDNIIMLLYGENGNPNVTPRELIPNLRFQEFDRNIKILGETEVAIGIDNPATMYVSDGDPATV